MTLSVNCPECNYQFRLPDKYAGKRGKCPKCGGVFRAPAVEEDVADWSSEAEEIPGAGAGSESSSSSPRAPTAKPAGRPKIPLPKKLAEVTPPPAPDSGDELPDLAALSVPGGPPPAGPPVSQPADSAEEFPDLAALSESGPRSAAPAPSFDLPSAGQPAASGPPAAETGSPTAPVIDTGKKRSRRSSDVFDPSELAAQLEQVGPPGPAATPGETSPPIGPPPEQPTASAQPAASAPIIPPVVESAAKPAVAPVAKTPKPRTAQRLPKTATKTARQPKTAAQTPQAAVKTITAAKAQGDAPRAPAVDANQAKAAHGDKPELSAAPGSATPGLPEIQTAAAAPGGRKAAAPIPVAKSGKAKRAATPDATPAGAFSVATDLADSGAQARVGRGAPRKAKTPWLLIGVGGGVVALILLLVGGFVASSLLSSGEKEVAQSEPAPAETGNERDTEGGSAGRDAEGTAAPATAGSAELSSLKWDELRRAVVRVEVLSEGRKEIGTGFLIDPRGWVATAYSVIHHGESASVVTYEGRYLVAGTVAVSPECDLAILKIDHPGDEMALPVLPLNSEIDRVESQTAYLPGNYFSSQLSSSRCVAERSVPNGELRPALRPHVTERARENGLLHWIETSARASGSAHGGPLIDVEGRVIGVNSFFGDNGSYGYAIHVKHLVDLVASAGGEVKPLAPDPLARADVPDRPGGVAPPDDTGDEPGSADTAENNPPPDEDPFAAPPEVTAERLNEVFEACDLLSFLPLSNEDYTKFQDLALLFSEVQQRVDSADTPDDQRAEMAEVIKKVNQRLSRELWRDAETVNSLAAESLANSHRGVLFYGTVIQTKPKVAELGGRNVVLFRLDGADEFVVVPTSVALEKFPKQSRWLIMGVHNPHPPYAFNMRTPAGVEKKTQHVDAAFALGEPKMGVKPEAEKTGSGSAKKP